MRLMDCLYDIPDRNDRQFLIGCAVVRGTVNTKLGSHDTLGDCVNMALDWRNCNVGDIQRCANIYNKVKHIPIAASQLCLEI